MVCGAHTEFGQYILRELLYSSEIERVYAIASRKIDSMLPADRSVARKANILITPMDNLRVTLAKIPEADLAFCALGTERGAQNRIGITRFRTYNVDGPRRFVRGMFKLGVLYIAVLSHVKADKDEKSELFRARGELEEHVKAWRREAGDFSPFISIFKVSNMVGQYGGALSSSGHRSKRQDDTLEFQELATAMKFDALTKSARRRLSDPTKRRKYEEYDVPEIRRLSREDKYGVADESGDESEGRPFWHD